MSLGCRVCRKSTLLPFLDGGVLRTDFLPFLYPSWFTSTCTEVNQSVTSTRHASSQAARRKRTRSWVSISRNFSVSHGLTQVEQYEKADQKGTIRSTVDKPTTESKPRDILPEQGDVIEPDTGTLQPHGLTSATTTPPSSLVDLFRKTPDLVTSRKKALLKPRLTRQLKTRHNDALKLRGDWSYDWRIPLNYLRQGTLLETRTSPPKEPGVESTTEISKHVSRQQMCEDIPASKIPQPLVWTTETFSAYVKALTDSTVNRLLRQKVYPNGEIHDIEVTRILNKLFTTETNRPYWTAETFERVFKFLYTKSNVAEVRSLYNAMIDAGVEFRVQTFNTMLQGTARWRDLSRFTYILRVMLRRGIAPNLKTWAIFLEALSSENIQVLVVKEMQERGFLQGAENEAILRKAIAQIVRYEYEQNGATHASIQPFVSYMDKKYGKAWVSNSAGNMIAQHTGENGNLLHAAETIEFMNTRGYRPDQVSLNQMLGFSRSLGDLRLAQQILHVFFVKYNIKPDKDSYGILFQTANKKRWYNSSRVIWRAACLDAAVPYNMQALVYRSLKQNKPPTTTNKLQRGRLWREQLGKFVVGIMHNTRSSQSDINPILGIAKWAESDKERYTLRNRVSLLLSKDLHEPRERGLRLGDSFAGLLGKAIDLDQKWAATDAHSQWPLEKKLAAGIKVPFLYTKDKPSKHGADELTEVVPYRRRGKVMLRVKARGAHWAGKGK